MRPKIDNLHDQPSTYTFVRKDQPIQFFFTASTCGDDSEVPLTEVLRAQEEPTLANEDDITAANDRDYVLDGGGLVSNADAEITFIECVNNTTVDVTPQGRGQRKKRKMFFIHLICGQTT